jgi:hypothetical protein
MSMAKQKVYDTTTIARAKASVLKFRSAKKKASREAASKANHARAQSSGGQMAWAVPAIGVCTDCNRQFKVPTIAMKRGCGRAGNAQASICRAQMRARASVVPDVREAIENK